MGTFKEQQAACGFDVSGIEAMKLAVLKSKDAAFIQAMKDERPCVACGSHPCPPGSNVYCYTSTDETLNITRIVQPALEAFAAQYGHPY